MSSQHLNCPAPWRDEQLPDGTTRLSVPRRFGSIRPQFVFGAIFAFLGIWSELVMGGIGPVLFFGLLTMACVQSLINQHYAVQQELFVRPGLLELRRQRLGKPVLGARCQDALLGITAESTETQSSYRLEVWNDCEKHLILSGMSRDEVLDAGYFLANLTGFRLTDSVSPDSLLRDTVVRKFAAGDAKAFRRVLFDTELLAATVEVWHQGSRTSRAIMTTVLSEAAEISVPETGNGEQEKLHVVRRLLSTSQGQIKVSVLEVLEKLERSRAAPVLREALGDADLEVRRQALAALCRLQDLESVPALCEMASNPDPVLSSTAIRGLTEMADPQALPTFCAVLGSPAHPFEPELKSAAAAALGRLRMVEGVPFLVGAFQDPAAQVRQAAAAAVGRIGHPSAAAGLATLIADASAAVRASVAEALGRIGTPESDHWLHTLAGDSVREVRLAAVEALGARGAETGINILTRTLEDPDSAVRRESARALGLIALHESGPPVALRTALPRLRRLSTKVSLESADVKRACRVALIRIEQRTVGVKSLPLPIDGADCQPTTLPVPHRD